MVRYDYLSPRGTSRVSVPIVKSPAVITPTQCPRDVAHPRKGMLGRTTSAEH
jgi:hypothetical protein